MGWDGDGKARRGDRQDTHTQDKIGQESGAGFAFCFCFLLLLVFLLMIPFSLPFPCCDKNNDTGKGKEGQEQRH